MLKKIYNWVEVLVVLAGVIVIARMIAGHLQEAKILKQIISRLEADSRAAEVLVTRVSFNEEAQKTDTTIKFLEYDSKGRALMPKYFTFAGNIIQFQSLVIRFDDLKVQMGDKLRGKSAYLFLKAFMLDGANTQEFEITPVNDIPAGYKLDNVSSEFEKKLWQKFWAYAVNPSEAKQMGIKNAQIEAPGTAFVPGTLYTIKIEHDGGLRIDAEPLSQILRGETIK